MISSRIEDKSRLLIDPSSLNWLVTLPLELTAASITLSFWPGAKEVNPAAFVVIFWFAVVLINFFGVRGYGEAEFVFSIIKVIAVGLTTVCAFGCGTN